VVCAGCAAPFTVVKASASGEGVTVTQCGTSATSTRSVMKSLDPPSAVEAELHGGYLEPPKELNVCIKLDNKSGKPARFDRAVVQLKHPREREDWVADADDQVVVVQPGGSREVRLSFHYGPMDAGEEVSILFSRALSIGGKPVKLDSIVFRKK
jgi:hypothetical protein